MGKVYVVFGRAGFFCGPNCIAGYRADRKAGVIYPCAVLVGPKHSVTVSILEFSVVAEQCVYCGRHWKKERKNKSNAKVLRHVDRGLEGTGHGRNEGCVVGKGLGVEG